jgi:hypothetical protein
MGKEAIILEVTDNRSSRQASAHYHNWRSMTDSLNPITLSDGGGIGKVKEVHKYYNNRSTSGSSDDAYYNLGVGTNIAFSGNTSLIASSVSINGGDLTVQPNSVPSTYYFIITCSSTYDGAPEVPSDSLMNQLISTDKTQLMTDHQTWWDNFWNKSFVDIYGVPSTSPLQNWFTSMYTYAVTNNSKRPTNFNNVLMVQDDIMSWGNACYWQNNRFPAAVGSVAGHSDWQKKWMDFYDGYWARAKSDASLMGKLGVRLVEAPPGHKPGIPVTHNVTTFDQTAFDNAVNDTAWESNISMDATARSFQQNA